MKRNGFSLIELLIVLAILGIIAAVIIPNLGAFMKESDLAPSANHTISKVADNMYWIEITSRSLYISDDIVWMNTAFADLSANVTRVVIVRTGNNEHIEGAYVIVK